LSIKEGIFLRNLTFSLRNMEMAPKNTSLSKPLSIFVSSGGRYKGMALALIPGTFLIALR